MELRIGELREDYALRKIPTRSFEANALYLEIIRLAYNLVTAFQRQCLQESWQNLTLAKLRYKLSYSPANSLALRIVPCCGSVSLRCYETWLLTSSQSFTG